MGTSTADPINTKETKQEKKRCWGTFEKNETGIIQIWNKVEGPDYKKTDTMEGIPFDPDPENILLYEVQVI